MKNKLDITAGQGVLMMLCAKAEGLHMETQQ